MASGFARRLATVLTLAGVTWFGLGAADGATAAVTGPLLTQVQAATRFQTAGVDWAATGNCVDRYNPTCTSFGGIRKTTVEGVLTLKAASGCDLTITGGTETGHTAGTYSHWNGWKVDFRRNSCIDAYVTRYFTRVGFIPGWGDQWRARSGNLYTNESSHWDVLFYTCGCDH